MKEMLKQFVGALMSLITIMVCGASAFADTVKITNASDARYGVVWIHGEGRTYVTDNNGKIVRNEAGEILVRNAAWSGTGFAIGDPNKPIEYIVTNAHVVLDDFEEQCDLSVYFSYAQNDFVKPTIYKIDKEKDIAILKLPEPTDKRTALVLCPSDKVDMNDEVTALGYPGVSEKLTDNVKYDTTDVTVTRGIISRKFYQNENMRSMYQIDAYINHGNSGGPLVNSKGEVVGINSEGLPGEANVNAAICIDELINLVTRDQVGYVISTGKSGFNPVPIIIIAAVVVVVAVIAVAVVATKKKKVSVPTNNPAPAPQTPVRIQAPSSVGNATLICEKGLLAGRTFPVGNGVVIGRNTQKCGVCFPIDAKGVSGVHCEIRKTANGFEILDLGSSYGTTLGSGQKLTPNVPVFIPNGTYFSIGSADQLFQIKY